MKTEVMKLYENREDVTLTTYIRWEMTPASIGGE